MLQFIQPQKRDGAKKMEEQAKVGAAAISAAACALAVCCCPALNRCRRPQPGTTHLLVCHTMRHKAARHTLRHCFVCASFAVLQALASEAASEARAAQKARVTVSKSG